MHSNPADKSTAQKPTRPGACLTQPTGNALRCNTAHIIDDQGEG